MKKRVSVSISYQDGKEVLVSDDGLPNLKSFEFGVMTGSREEILLQVAESCISLHRDLTKGGGK